MLKICRQCKKYFSTPNRKRIYCSRNCYALNRTLPQRKCIVCGKLFSPNCNKRKMCSVNCSGIHYSTTYKNKISVGKNNPNYIDGRTFCKCVLCGKDFRGDSIRKYCSRRCYQIDHSRKMKDSGNPNWQGGKANHKYGLDFSKKLKTFIKYRDKNKCVLCGKNNNLLHVHHIDYDKKSNNLNNLVSLDNVCHGKTHYNRLYWEKYFKNIMLAG